MSGNVQEEQKPEMSRTAILQQAEVRRSKVHGYCNDGNCCIAVCDLHDQAQGQHCPQFVQAVCASNKSASVTQSHQSSCPDPPVPHESISKSLATPEC